MLDNAIMTFGTSAPLPVSPRLGVSVPEAVQSANHLRQLAAWPVPWKGTIKVCYAIDHQS
jgi:hypothetical protein